MVPTDSSKNTNQVSQSDDKWSNYPNTSLVTPSSTPVIYKIDKRRAS